MISAQLKKMLPKSAKNFIRTALVYGDMSRYGRLFKKYSYFTMIPKGVYKENLRLAHTVAVAGDVVECGSWRGGMVAGIAELLGGKNRKYYLFDSFEGLPLAKAIDGDTAIAWQQDTTSDIYFDNCTADIADAKRAMEYAGVPYECIKGWFDDTVPHNTIGPIALLRLDGDWYDSTMVCLKHLYPKVVTGGLIIIDDYAAWDGCSRAVHDYLSSIQSKSRIGRGSKSGVAYIVKHD